MLNPQTAAFVFPGQGSQMPGMGAQLAQTFRVAAQTFQEADDVLGFSLSTLCFEGPETTLNETLNAQPALFTAGIAALRTLYEELPEGFLPTITAGHSLGQLTALCAAGAMSFEDGLRLVRRRGELMSDAGEHSPGGMVAVLGLETDKLNSICKAAQDQTGGVAVVANDNCPGQVVIAGDDETLLVAMEQASAVGARRVVRLQVSIAAHSPLMARVAADFRAALESTHFSAPMIPIIGNVRADRLVTVEDVRKDLGAQLTSPVRWTESVQLMLSEGIDTYIELGSKDVLTGLLKRIDRSTTRLVIDSPDSISRLLNTSS